MASQAFERLETHVRVHMQDARAQRCCEAGCELRLEGLPPFILLSGERIAPDQARRMCDCVVFVEQGPIHVALVELKGKTVHADEVVEKLRNSSEAVLGMFRDCSLRVSQRSIHFLVLARRWSRPQLKVLQSKHVTVAGVKHGILSKRCGFSLADTAGIAAR
ncbi:MAG: hypothetical protein FJ291_05055 [Planctomycetes bacterium]|nr:hypothetical protein [Planctomycetota bacterium]